MSIWPVIAFAIVLIFNVGMFVAYMRNHAKHTKEAIGEIKADIDNIYSKVNTNATDIARLEGRLNNKK